MPTKANDQQQHQKLEDESHRTNRETSLEMFIWREVTTQLPHFSRSEQETSMLARSEDSGCRSEDTNLTEEEDAACPSTRAFAGKQSLSRRRLSITSSTRGEEDDDDDGVESKIENASYPTCKAFQIERSLSREKINSNGGNGSLVDQLLDENQGIDFMKDSTSGMTWGRRIALKWLIHKKWYNPRAGQPETKSNDVESPLRMTSELPSLQKAWTYFEHVALTRHVLESHNTNVEGWNILRRIVYSFQNFKEEFERAQPGESQRPTKLYDPITTPHMQLGDFGLGFGLYFSTLRAIGYILFVAGLISTFNIYFFASVNYRNEELSNPLLIGSAICTRTEWVPCLDCDCGDDTQGWKRTNRCTVTEDGGLTLVLKNQCLEQPGFMWKLGLINYGAMVFMLLAILALGAYLKDQAAKFDEDEQTAQDYSIQISNPPPKATDPEVWRHYFESNFVGVKCAAITCAVNNDLLIRALVARRQVLRMMELQLDSGTPMDIDHLALLAAKEARSRNGYGLLKRGIALVVGGLPELLSRFVALNTSIKGLAQLSYPCTNVFVTFEKERDQREVLSKLSVGQFHVRRNHIHKLEDLKYAFDGKVLEASESVEPDTVRWQDLNVTVTERMDQMILTNILTFGSIIVVAWIVSLADELSAVGAAFSIAGFNLAFPEFAKLITLWEAHPTESKLQTSMYFKVALFRWVNTAIVITFITPFTHTLAAEDGLIPQISAIFFAEIVTTNLIQLTDVWGHFQRHVLAPRMVTQDTMNICFQGLEVELAERYTNMTKIMFLAFWYSSIFPGALFLGAIALWVNYYTDRFSLMRTWKRAPHVSREISSYSQHYFFSSACIFLAVMSSFYWSAFPFDNLCEVEDASVNSTYVGTHEVNVTKRFQTEPNKPFNTTVKANSTVFKFCAQDYILGTTGATFPFLYGEWMDDDQQRLAILFGWTSFAVIVLTGGKFLFSLMGWIRGQFFNVNDAPEDEQGIGFHDVRNIAGYIPQVRSGIFSYPLIACKCDTFGETLFDWTDPDRDYTYYDLTKDADHVLSGTNRRAKQSFSRVKHWPPNGRKEDLKRKKRELEARLVKGRNLFNSISVVSSRNLFESSPHDRSSRKRPSTAVGSSLLGSNELQSVPEKLE